MKEIKSELNLMLESLKIFIIQNLSKNDSINKDYLFSSISPLDESSDIQSNLPLSIINNEMKFIFSDYFSFFFTNLFYLSSITYHENNLIDLDEQKTFNIEHVIVKKYFLKEEFNKPYFDECIKKFFFVYSKIYFLLKLNDFLTFFYQKIHFYLINPSKLEKISKDNPSKSKEFSHSDIKPALNISHQIDLKETNESFPIVTRIEVDLTNNIEKFNDESFNNLAKKYFFLRKFIKNNTVNMYNNLINFISLVQNNSIFLSSYLKSLYLIEDKILNSSILDILLLHQVSTSNNESKNEKRDKSVPIDLEEIKDTKFEEIFESSSSIIISLFAVFFPSIISENENYTLDELYEKIKSNPELLSNLKNFENISLHSTSFSSISMSPLNITILFIKLLHNYTIFKNLQSDILIINQFLLDGGVNDLNNFEEISNFLSIRNNNKDIVINSFSLALKNLFNKYLIPFEDIKNEIIINEQEGLLQSDFSYESKSNNISTTNFEIEKEIDNQTLFELNPLSSNENSCINKSLDDFNNLLNSSIDIFITNINEDDINKLLKENNSDMNINSLNNILEKGKKKNLLNELNSFLQNKNTRSKKVKELFNNNNINHVIERDFEIEENNTVNISTKEITIDNEILLKQEDQFLYKKEVHSIFQQELALKLNRINSEDFIFIDKDDYVE